MTIKIMTKDLVETSYHFDPEHKAEVLNYYKAEFEAGRIISWELVK